jgi:hypothetical protein
MSFGHERLDVYRAAIEYVGWAFSLMRAAEGPSGSVMGRYRYRYRNRYRY